ncbi:MAG: hypothetical protein ACOC6D_04705 [Atribacterota bacterium]
MKSKIVGIIVCMMLMTTFFTVAQNDPYFEKKPNKKLITNSFDDNVPTWNETDSWTYKIDDINFNFDIGENSSINMHIQIDNLPMDVKADTGDAYDVKFSAKIGGNYSINIEQDNSTIDVEGRLLGTRIEGDIFFTKTELGIKKIDATLSGILTVKINELLESPIPEIPFPIPIPATIDTILDFSTPYTLLDFPLNTSKMWGLPDTNFTLNGEIRSIWLNIINLINNIATALESPILDSEIADLLPVVDIQKALEAYGMNNTFRIPEIPSIFSCNNTEPVEVPGGTFDAYNISIAGGLGKIYYAPEVKNIIKISGELEEVFQYITDIDMELIDYKLA